MHGAAANLSRYDAVEGMVRIAEAREWSGPAAFDIAMRLYVEGVTPAQAERLFARAERWTQ